MFDQLANKINRKTARIGVVGLGYVGLPLLGSVLKSGFQAHGFDIDQNKLHALNMGKSYLEHVSVDTINGAIKRGECSLSVSFDEASECDVIVLCVPTPLNSHREPDLSFVMSSLEGLFPYLRPGQALSLESTTYPGTTEDCLLPILSKSFNNIGDDFFLIYSPEREDPGNKNFGFSQIPKVVSGITPNCKRIAELFYGSIVGRTVSVSSTKCAEMTKILENTYRSVNIALVNELKIVADAMGIDIFEVISAASTKPFGYQPFYPGPGLGGHCIPIDPFYLTWKAREYGLHTRFIELAGEINTSMPDFVVNKISLGLNQNSKSIKDSKILILGVAYKKNVGDVRESPGIEIIDKLQKLGADVSYHDPFVNQIPKMRKYKLMLKSIDISASVIADYDACVIVTDHDDVDYNCLQDAVLVIDTRGRLDQSAFPNRILA